MSFISPCLLLHMFLFFFFFFNDTATTEIYTLSLHDAMAINGDALTGRDARRVHERLVELAERDLPPAELFARADDLLRTVIPFDASGWLTTDPATSLATGVAMVTGVPETTAAELLEHEIIDPGM